MKYSILIVLGGTLAMFITIPQMAAATLTHKAWPGNTFSETDEIRQTFKLTPGTLVEISRISGAVDIETANNDTAEILITRTAESRAALQEDKITVEYKADRLIIRGEAPENVSGKMVDVSHHVKLKLPRHINLTCHSIAGPIRLGDLDGQFAVTSVSGPIKAGAVGGTVQINGVSGDVTLGNVAQKVGFKSISGNLNIARVNGSLEITGVSGTVTIDQVAQSADIRSLHGDLKIVRVGGPLELTGVSGTVTIDQVSQSADIKSINGNLKIGWTDASLDISAVSGDLSAGIAKLGTRGVKIGSVTRQVELRFKGEVDAQFSAQNISKPVSLDLPNVNIEEKSAAGMRARIGKGGPPISISGASGNVRLLLDTQTRSQE